MHELPLFDKRTLTLDERARAFHQRNPQVYAKLREFALEAQRTGATQFGIGAIWERLRWHAAIESSGDKYVLNNSYRAWYARELMRCEPVLAGFFATRESATDPSFHERRAS